VLGSAKGHSDSFVQPGPRRDATIRLCDQVYEGVQRFVWAPGSAKGRDDSFVRPGPRRGAMVRLCDRVCEGVRRFVLAPSSVKGRDDSYVRRGAMIRLDTWLHEGARHPQRTRRFTMATFAVPVREQGCTTKEGRFEDKKSKKIYAIPRQTKSGELPQGARSLHLGGLALP
jgi:hypothetical protein